MVQKGTTKEGKEKKGRRRQTTKKEREPWRNSRFISGYPRMFFVCFAILS